MKTAQIRSIAVGLATIVGLAGTAAVSMSVVSAQTTVSAYEQVVRGDGASSYWRLGGAAGSTVAVDSMGTRNVMLGSGALGVAGALNGDSDTAAVSSSNGFLQTAPVPTGARSIEAWVKAPVGSEGVVIKSGTLSAGFIFNGFPTLDTGTYSVAANIGSHSFVPGPVNDGQWHHFVLTVGPTYALLYVDSVLASARSYSDTTATEGVWVGDLGQSIDEVAYYPTQLTNNQVRGHWFTGMTGRACSASPPVTPYEQLVLADGATSHWRSESSGRLAIDQIGCRSGRFSGVETTGISNSGGRTGGQFGGLLVTGVPTGVRSVEAWIQTPVNAVNDTLFGQAELNVSLSATGSLQLNTSTSPAGSPGASTSIVVNDGEWHHFAMTVGPATASLYVDSVLVSAKPHVDSLPRAFTWVGFIGYSFDEVAVYSGQLSATQIATHFELGKGGSVSSTTTSTSSSTSTSTTSSTSTPPSTIGTETTTTKPTTTKPTTTKPATTKRATTTKRVVTSTRPATTVR